MFANIFYTIGGLVILMGIFNILHFFKYYNVVIWYRERDKLSKSKIRQNDFRSTEDYNLYVITNFFSLLQGFWMWIGLFTKDWGFFLILIGLSLLFALINLILKSNILEKSVVFAYNIFKTLVIIMLVYNHFFLHYTLGKYLF